MQNTLSKTQMKTLKNLAHHLKPIIIIGQHGLSDNVLNEIEIALDHHELVKIKIAAGDRDDREAICLMICEKTEATKIQSIGKTLTIFRKNPKKPKIKF